MQESQERAEYTVVARKPSFGLPTGCPICLPLFIYLKFSNFPFHLVFNNTFPDSEWISMKAMVSTWLADAIMYELWVGSDGTSARTIYHSGLPWLIGKALLMKQVHVVKQRLGITKENAERREAEIYKRAKIAFGALSTKLGDHAFLFERPSSLDAYFLGHVLFTLQAFPESSMLQSALLEHGNLIRYAEKLKTDFMEAGSSSSVLQFLSDASSTSTRRPSNSGKIFSSTATMLVTIYAMPVVSEDSTGQHLPLFYHPTTSLFPTSTSKPKKNIIKP